MSFCITRHKGVHIGFKNGCAISIQWGPGNYCDRKEEGYDAVMKADSWESKTAEVAVFGTDGGFLRVSPYDDVTGWNSADHVSKVMEWVRSLPEGSTRTNTEVPAWVGSSEE